MPHHLIKSALKQHQEVMKRVAGITDEIAQSASKLTKVLQGGGKVLVCGNGGSAADSQHFAAEISGRFEIERRGYPAIALTTDSSALTAVSNDYGFEAVFSRQLEALGQPGDLLIAISTSGNSPNILRAVETARQLGLYSIGLLGRDGGQLAEKVDLPLVVPSDRTARIQEAHIFILHTLCELFEAQI